MEGTATDPRAGVEAQAAGAEPAAEESRRGADDAGAPGGGGGGGGSGVVRWVQRVDQARCAREHTKRFVAGLGAAAEAAAYNADRTKRRSIGTVWSEEVANPPC